jgi:ATP-binding cassette subfamily B protein
MSEKFNVMQAAMASSERIFKLLDEPVAITSPPHALTLVNTKTAERAEIAEATRFAAGSAGSVVPVRAAGSRIVFDHVWFAYNDADWVLKDVSFEVKPGERLGIVGATGSGKTTIINLLLRYYDVQRGRITIDSIDIRELDLHDLRGLFSLVLQDVHLFSGTIADNIRLGQRSMDQERVERAARAVHADRFIERMPAKYQAAVAERGSTLSVGQKQLLSFARALAFDPTVLILDEATSSVDTETELLIRDALETLMAGRTTIAIAHRLSTIQDMDQILVLHKGAVREAGTHQELLARRGIYFKLFQLQYRNEQKLELRS